MDLFQLISHFRNYIFLCLMFFFMNNLLAADASENNLNHFNSQNEINFSQHDKLDNQLKLFLGFDPENPGISYYPDSLIINYSDSVRNMYKSKLNDMTINKKKYKIENE